MRESGKVGKKQNEREWDGEREREREKEKFPYIFPTIPPCHALHPEHLITVTECTLANSLP